MKPTTFQLSKKVDRSVFARKALLAFLLCGAMNVHAAPPSNDDFANRKVLSGISASDTIINMHEATIEGGEPLSSSIDYSVWYEWTAPDDGVLRIDATNSEYDMELDVFFGNSIGTLKRIFDDQGNRGSSGTAVIEFPVTAGSHFLIRYGADTDYPYVNEGEIGYLFLNLRTDTQFNGIPLQRPSAINNDLFSDRVPLSGNELTVITYQAHATREGGEPLINENYTQWWEYTPSTNGKLRLESLWDSFDELYLFSGPRLAQLTLLGGADNLEEPFEVTVNGGATYYITMGSDFYNTPTIGVFSLNFTSTTSPTPTPGPTPTPNPGTGSVFDLNNDGNNDLFFQNYFTGSLSAARMDGTSFIGESSYSNSGGGAWRVVAVADMDEDGDADLVWQNFQNGKIAVWIQDGSQFVVSRWFTDQQGAVIQPGGPWRIAAVADIDGDGKNDLVWQKTSNGRVAVWFMDGTTFTGSALFSNQPGNADWRVTAAPDLDSDGDADLFWQNYRYGSIAGWEMNGLNFIDGLPFADQVRNTVWKVVAVQDMDGDGDVDLVWQNARTFQSVIWFLFNNLGLSDGNPLGITINPGWEIRNQRPVN